MSTQEEPRIQDENFLRYRQFIQDYYNRPTSQRKPRTRFTDYQKVQLELMFAYAHYLPKRGREAIAFGLGLTIPQLTIWFQNRRAKWRKYGC